MAKTDLRSQLKATTVKRLQKQIDEDNAMVGVQNNEYLNLEDGKTFKIRIFPGHPGVEDFYIARKCYWLSFVTEDGEERRGTVLDSKVHGGTKYDLVEEYVKWAKKKVGNDVAKLDALVGTGPKSNSLNPQYSWICYADRMNGDDPLRARLWEFKKMVRDAINKLAMSEDEDEPIEVDPFTDPDEGLPISVTYRKQPNKKKGEQFYEVAFPKKVTARALTDEEIEYFMTLKPLNEIIPHYSIREFERALEGLQNFDEQNEIGLFDDDAWLEHVEEIKSQYDGEEEEEEEKPTSRKPAKKVAKKVEQPEEEEDDEEEEDKPSKSAAKKPTKPEPEDEEEEEEEDDSSEEGDEFDDMDRNTLKKYIASKGLNVSVKKSMSDDDLRNAIRAAYLEETEEEEEEEEEKQPGKVSLDAIRSKLAGKK